MSPTDAIVMRMALLSGSVGGGGGAGGGGSAGCAGAAGSGGAGGGSVVVDDAAALGSGDTHDQVEVVRLRQLAPAVDNVAVVLGRGGQAGAVEHAVVIEEHAKHFVALLKGRLGEMVSRVGRLMLVGTLVHLYCQFHNVV